MMNIPKYVIQAFLKLTMDNNSMNVFNIEKTIDKMMQNKDYLSIEWLYTDNNRIQEKINLQKYAAFLKSGNECLEVMKKLNGGIN